jgi:hypothetical protein
MSAHATPAAIRLKLVLFRPTWYGPLTGRKAVTSGPTSARRCVLELCSSPSCASVANSISPARSWTAPRSVRCAGGKKLDRTQPIAVRRGRNITFSPRRTAFADRHRDCRQSARRDPVDPVGRSHPAVARPPRAVRTTALIQGDRGYDSQPHRELLHGRGIQTQLAKRRMSLGSACAARAGSSNGHWRGFIVFVASTSVMSAVTVSTRPWSCSVVR